MNRELVDLLAGAGLTDIVMPRKKFMAEHKYLIGLLRKYNRFPDLKKEADEQEAEMKSYTGGFSKQSGFIRRMMAENALKHSGQYRKPTDPLAPGSTMNKPVAFDYKKLATPEQKGTKRTGNPYGASPFIQRHFGTTEYVPFERKRGEPLPTAPFPNKKRSKKAPVEAVEAKTQTPPTTPPPRQTLPKTPPPPPPAPKPATPPRDIRDLFPAPKPKPAEDEEEDVPIRPFGFAEDGKKRPPSPPRKSNHMAENPPMKPKPAPPKAAPEPPAPVVEAPRPEPNLKAVKKPEWWNYLQSAIKFSETYIFWGYSPTDPVYKGASITRILKGMDIKASGRVDDGLVRTRETNPIWKFFRLVMPEEYPTSAETQGKSEKAIRAREKKVELSREDYEVAKANREKILRLMKDYLEWVFTVAMPLYGYSVVDYKPREADFPMGESYLTGKPAPSGTRHLIGLDRDGYRETDPLPPLPDRIKILVHPSGDFGWLLGTKEDVYDELAKRTMKLNTSGDNFALRTLLQKDGSHWSFVEWKRTPKPITIGDYTFKNSSSATLLGSNPAKVGEKRIEWTEFKEGIQQIVQPVIDELNSRDKRFIPVPVDEWY